MKNKVRVVFENEKVRFVTHYSGDIKYLRDILSFSGNYTNAMLHAFKIRERIDFSILNIRNTPLDLMHFIYDIKYYKYYQDKKQYDYVNLDIFKILVEPYGFKVENMYIIETEK